MTEPQLPTNAITRDGIRVNTEGWFEYPVRVYPHHTDYAGIVWHGTYVQWLEEARVECLLSIGFDYGDLVRMGYSLPVVELSVRYHKSLTLGMDGILKTRVEDTKGSKIDWDYRLESVDGQELFLTARVSLVAIDNRQNKIMRRLPPIMEDIFKKLTQPH